MNILLIGSGAREHALAWKIARSPLVDEVWSAPGNPGLDRIGPCFDVKADDVAGLEKLALQLSPDLVVIGPEAPLALGLADRLRLRGFDVFGPDQAPARLESSKAFAKARMAAYGVPTAEHVVVADMAGAAAHLEAMPGPYVLKADGLAAGKGVVICQGRAEAMAETEAMLEGRFGAASSDLVIESFMAGEEASVFVLSDGEAMVMLPAAQDHKRIGEGDTGANTGGMGAYVPTPAMTPALMKEVRETIAEPMLAGMKRDGMAYRGVLYIGLMLTATGPKVVEFNARFGDPECQALMAGLPGDIVPALLMCATGGLAEREIAALLQLDAFQPAATIVMASAGYPGAYERGAVIEGLETAEALEGVHVFQAGTDRDAAGRLVTAGGRVLSVTGTGDTLEVALRRAYDGVSRLDWPGAQWRSDIGWRARTG